MVRMTAKENNRHQLQIPFHSGFVKKRIEI